MMCLQFTFYNVRDIKREGKGGGCLILYLSLLLKLIKTAFSPTTLYIILEYILFPELLLFSKEEETKKWEKGERSNLTFWLHGYGTRKYFSKAKFYKLYFR